MASSSEFFPKDRHPQSLVPRPGFLRRLYCRITGAMFGGSSFGAASITRSTAIAAQNASNSMVLWTPIEIPKYFRVIFRGSREPMEHFTL